MKRTTLAIAGLSAAALAASGNMNGKYSVASGDHQDTGFNDDYSTKGMEYFDVWAPEISTHYGEVFWTDQHNQPLPKDIIARFKGKTMAITGYEQDQVMVIPQGQPGANPGKDVSVPINWAYNHHYMAWMTGEYSAMERVARDPDDVLAHGAPRKWVAVDTAAAALRADPSVPTSQMFSEGNGGESRKSFHGYPDGFAQLIESPETWHITPMQIDTRNRDCGATPNDVNNCSKFVPGIEPKQARYGLGAPKGTDVSGILECPCTSRYGGDPDIYSGTKTKDQTHQYNAVGAPACQKGESIKTPQECWDSLAAIGLAGATQKTTSNPKIPSGCSVVEGKDGSVTAYFNTAAASTACSAAPLRAGEVTSAVKVTLKLSLDALAGEAPVMARSPAGQYCSQNHNNVLEKFVMATAKPADAEVALKQCESYCTNNTACSFCSIDCSLGSQTRCQWVAIPECGALGSLPKGQPWLQGDVSSKQGGLATIELSGPSDVWFGVGFNAVEMDNQPWTIVVTPDSVFEQKLGTCGSEADHCPGTLLNKSITVVSNKVTGGIRTITATRPLQGLTKDHYSFTIATATIPTINAVGSSGTFGYHKAHALAVITLLAANENTCVCDTGASGKMCDQDGKNCDSFVKSCVAPPAGSLLEQKNPTCNSRDYAGGLRCCHHGRIMLDVDQPVRPELLKYHMKFRFWFQEYTPAAAAVVAVDSKPSHFNLDRIYQQTEANAGEYDIPPAFAKPGFPIPGYHNWPAGKPTPGTTCTGTCPDGPDCECTHTIHYHWVQNPTKPMRLIYAGGHCHAPSCLSIQLFRNDTGELLCQQTPKMGNGTFPANKFDEKGYIALPPCLWGDDKGLQHSFLLPPGTPLLSIKKNRNTHMGHFGEMASWQMRGVSF